MIAAAKSVGGVPPVGRDRLDDCFTYEPSLEAVILWYNVDGDTKVDMQPVEAL